MKNSDLYWRLLHDGNLLKQLYQSCNLEEFVGRMSQYLHCPGMEFEQVLAWFHIHNQQFIVPELNTFSQYWQPAEYRQRDRSVSWVPAFQALQLPFYQDDMAYQRRTILGQLLKPVCKVTDLLSQSDRLAKSQPDLIIFHWSRCGSTLLAGLYRQLRGVKLLSESMLISNLLQDPKWSYAEKATLLTLVMSLQGRARHAERQLVVKCNAWDLQLWPLWLQQFPDSKVLCLGREPEQILASHQRISGLHMAGGKTGVWVDVDPWHQATDLLDGRIKVLNTLMQYTEQLVTHSNAIFLNYQQLLQRSPQWFASILGRVAGADECQSWQAFKAYDAKEPSVSFQNRQHQPEVFTEVEQIRIQTRLSACYQSLQQLSTS